ncbi:hypothetical protein OG252_44905 [Streptomyces sp. NBC_01352]|uniref:hypothetical protein n=1 Tax=Streptomyces sp. NBC_01352 TaxID=2903834 RepID=UPI002E308153|nr:hypothetical protein [Streptomyces sp. NBC_01352]
MAAHTALGTGSEAVFTLFQLTILQTGLGNPRAAETARHALATAEAHGDRWGRAHALLSLGVAAHARGEPAAALELTRTALEIERGFTDYIGAVVMLEHFAWMTASCGDHERAARQLGAANALLRDIGTSLSAIPPVAEGHAYAARKRSSGPWAGPRTRRRSRTAVRSTAPPRPSRSPWEPAPNQPPRAR